MLTPLVSFGFLWFPVSFGFLLSFQCLKSNRPFSQELEGPNYNNALSKRVAHPCPSLDGTLFQFPGSL